MMLKKGNPLKRIKTMGKVKDILLRAWRRVALEYTRVDRTCNNCGREIFGGESFAEDFFCPDCTEHLPLNNGYICDHCGRSVVSPTSICDDCAGFEWSFNQARSPFYYAPPIDNLIRRHKYDNRRYLSKVFVEFMSSVYAKYFVDADVMTFVPMTEKARRKRGFNQSELIARRLSEKTGLKTECLLEKTMETERQAKLGRAERLSNLKGSFIARNKGLIKGKTILLIDDVMTTSATAESVSSVLKKAGAKKVYVLTVASVTNIKMAKALGQEQSSQQVSVKKKKHK